MSRKKKKTAAAPTATSQAQPNSSNQSAMRLLTPLSKGQRFHSPRLARFGRALWRGGARFTRTFLSMAGLLLLDSARASVRLARGAPEWLRGRWAQGRGVAGAPPGGSSSSSSSSASSASSASSSSSPSPSSSLPKDAWDVSNSGWMLQQFKAVEELQRTARQLVEQRVSKSDIQFDHHVQRTEGDVSISIRSTSSIRIESAGESGPRDAGKEDGGSSGRIESAGERGAASSRKVEKVNDSPSTRMDTAGERSAASPRQVDKADDVAPVMIKSGSEPSVAMSRVDDKSNDRPIIRRYQSKSSPRDDTSRDQVLAHMDLVMQKMPIPARATVTDKRGKDHNKHRSALRADVLRKYGAENRKKKVWCCIRRRWMESHQVRTAHICPVNLSEAYLQYVFGDKGPHLWNPENAIPISCELEEALDAGQLVIVPAEAEDGDSDDLFLWDAPDDSVPQTNRFKIVVFDDAVQTRDGKLKACDLHGRLLGFQDPEFRPGMRYICFNVVTTLARRMRYKVRGSHNDLERLGNSRFLLAPGKFVRDSWLLKMCAQIGIDIDPKPYSKPDVALVINGTSESKPSLPLDINAENGTSGSKPDVGLEIDGNDISDSTLEIAPDTDSENNKPNSKPDVGLEIDGEKTKPDPKPYFALNIDDEDISNSKPDFALHLEGSDMSDLPPDVGLHTDAENNKSDSKPDFALEMGDSDMTDLMLDIAPNAENNKPNLKPDFALSHDGSDTSDSTLDTAPDTDAESYKSKSKTDIAPGTEAANNKPNSKTDNDAEPGFMEFFGPYDAQKSSWNARRVNLRRRRLRRSPLSTSLGIGKPYTDLTPIRI